MIRNILAVGIPWLVMLGLSVLAAYYHDKYQDEQNRADAAEHSLSLANAAINDMRTRQRAIAELDAKYTRELANAQSQIEVLRGDVAAGKRRLQLNATCAPVRDATSAAGVDDATSTRLTDSANRDYFTLRERISVAMSQITALQEYINTQCQK